MLELPELACALQSLREVLRMQEAPRLPSSQDLYVALALLLQVCHPSSPSSEDLEDWGGDPWG